MPSSRTFAPACCAVRVIQSRFSSMLFKGSPRSASLPPSSITTRLGWCCASKAARRERPPDVVSPLTLALSTVTWGRSCRNCCSSRATQPVPRARPYSALSESPSTSTSAGRDAGAWAIAAAASRRAAAHTIKARRCKLQITIEPFMSDPSTPPPASPQAVAATAMIAVEHVFKSVTDSTGTLDILRDIDFRLAARETVAIVGASGSGKSSLLAIIAGLDCPTRGTVRLGGHDLFAIDEDARAALRAQQLGFVFQSFQLMGHLTALENVMLPLELANRRDARQAATEMLARAGLCRAAGRAAGRRAYRQPGLCDGRDHHATDVRAQPRAGHDAGAGHA